jgi:hypothetical protein
MNGPWAAILEIARTVFAGSTTLIGVLLWYRIGVLEKAVTKLEDVVYRRNGFQPRRGREAHAHD